MPTKKMRDSQLSSSVKISDYYRFKNNNEKDKIANFVYERFYERYIQPFEKATIKHGFSMMAISCLMIESLMSFKKGWNETRKSGGEVFEDFFSTAKHLSEFKGYGSKFYKNIRCGLLHQAESTGGWHILRKNELFNKKLKNINATKFLRLLDKELKEYIKELMNSELTSDIWKKTIKKIDHICENAKA